MTSDKIDKSSFRQQEIHIKANEVYIVNFNDTEPNSCFIFNRGIGNLFLSKNSNVSDTNYELLIAGGSTQSFVEVIEYKQLYFFSATDVDVLLKSFKTNNLAPTDIPETQPIVFVNTNPIVLGDIDTIANPVTLNPLPTGTNVIGKVQVSSLPNMVTTPTIQNLTLTNFFRVIWNGNTIFRIRVS